MLKQLTNHNTLIQPTNQSTLFFRRRCFLVKGTEQSVTDRLGKEVLQKWKKTILIDPRFVKFRVDTGDVNIQD